MGKPSMHIRYALIAFLFTSLGAQASAIAYQCAISEHLMQSKDGSLKRPPRPHLIGQRFSIDRKTGRLTGPESGFGFADSTYTVLAHGNAQNSYVSTIHTASAGNGIHFAVVRIEEFAEGKSKPFIVSDGGTIASGTCE